MDVFLVGLAALLVGISKTGVAGLGMVSAVLFADVMPARQSTATLLVLLIIGDLVASSAYRRHVDWRALVRLAPSVIVGVLLGQWYLAISSDGQLRRFIGSLVLFLCVLHVITRSRARPSNLPVALTAAAGTAAGFASMTANAAGPVMAIYLLNMHLGRDRYLGTTAWFFFALNLFKLPFSLHLGLLQPSAVASVAWSIPLVLLGAWLGRTVVRRLSQSAFEWLAILSATAGGMNLLLR